MDRFEIAPTTPRVEGLGWQAFTDVAFISEMLVVLAMAVALAALIAYHPAVRRKATTLEDFEQPKTFLLYSMVGAIITIIVKTMPEMALVVFGIGGLLRFRTHVGQAKDTGRVILVTVIGLACGLELYVVAVLTTALAWLLMLVLEHQSIESVLVQGLDAEGVIRASTDYGESLRLLGCTVLGETKNVRKGSLVVVYRLPRGLSREQIEARFGQQSGAERDTLSWD